MATTQTSSTRYSPQDNRELAIKLADACVNPSYMAELWPVTSDASRKSWPQDGPLRLRDKVGRQLTTTPAHVNYAKANS